MKIHSDFPARTRGTRGKRVYPSTPARSENAGLLAKLPAIAELPTADEWYWDENGLITF